MATKEALARAAKKYEQEKIDRVTMRVPRGKKALIQQFAAEHGETLNTFLNRAIDEAMKRG